MTSSLFSKAIPILAVVASASGQMRMPEPNPPFVSRPNENLPQLEASAGPAVTASPSIEWTLHKSIDGSHPSDSEQEMVWLMNRARRSPAIEGIWLAHLRQSNVQTAMDYFGVRRDILMDEFSARAAAYPAAFDARLYNAAANHSAYLISIDGQNHIDQFERIDDQGFHFSSASGSVYSYSKDPIQCHAAFNVDWGGDDGTGMQTGRGHREGLMGEYSSVGIACLPDNDPSTNVGPFVTTINYCNALPGYPDHHNRFIVGTVWNDQNANDLYDPGEGIGSVTVMPDKGTYYAVTGSAGGYAIPVDSGTYGVTFSGGGMPSTIVKTVAVGTTSVLVDCPLHANPIDLPASLTVGTDWMLTYTLTGQRKGCAYRLSTCTDLVSGNWTWADVLPSGYAETLTYSVELIDPYATQRFISLQGWQY